MKKNTYIQPVVEVTRMHTMRAICDPSKFVDLTNGGGTDAIDPITEGL